jgi:hypothetical protein
VDREGNLGVSGSADQLHDYAESLHRSIPCDELHPAARATVHTWLNALHVAADNQDERGFACLARMIADKVALELHYPSDDVPN